MNTGSDQLVVRQHQRVQCSLEAKVSVEASHAGAVVLARSAAEGGALSATIVDCSRGGLGLHTRVFLPRSCMVAVQLRDAAQASDGAPIVLACRVQRVHMIDRTPTFYLGLAIRADERNLEALNRVNAMATRDDPAADPAGKGGG